MPTPAFSINYIVRIYRWEKNKPSSLVGIVEEVGIKGRRAFTNYDELWEVLNSPNPLKPSLDEGRVRKTGKSLSSKRSLTGKGRIQEKRQR